MATRCWSGVPGSPFEKIPRSTKKEVNVTPEPYLAEDIREPQDPFASRPNCCKYCWKGCKSNRSHCEEFEAKEGSIMTKKYFVSFRWTRGEGDKKEAGFGNDAVRSLRDLCGHLEGKKSNLLVPDLLTRLPYLYPHPYKNSKS